MLNAAILSSYVFVFYNGTIYIYKISYNEHFKYYTEEMCCLNLLVKYTKNVYQITLLGDILYLQLHLYSTYMQSVPITTNVVSSNNTHGEEYSIQYYVIKFVSDVQQVSGFLQVLWFTPPIKLTATI